MLSRKKSMEAMETKDFLERSKNRRRQKNKKLLADSGYFINGVHKAGDIIRSRSQKKREYEVDENGCLRRMKHVADADSEVRPAYHSDDFADNRSKRESS